MMNTEEAPPKILYKYRAVGKNAEAILTIFDEFSVFAGEQIVNLINQWRGAAIVVNKQDFRVRRVL